MDGEVMPVGSRLLAIARAARRGRIAAGLLRFASLSLSVWLAWFVLDNLLRLPAAIRLPMSLAGIAIPAFSLWRNILRPSAWRLDPRRTARDLEMRLGMGDNMLINACQFEAAAAGAGANAVEGAKNGAPFFGAAGSLAGAGSSANASANASAAVGGASGATDGTGAAFAARTRDEGMRRAASVPSGALLDPRAIARVGAAALALAAAWAVYASACSRQASNALARFSRPFADIPPAGDIVVELSPSGPLHVAEGSSLLVRATLSAPDGSPVSPVPVPPVLKIAQGGGFFSGGAETEAEMTLDPDEPSAFFRRFDNIREDFRCRAECGADRSVELRVTVERMPRIVSSAFGVEPPEYLGLPADERAGPPAALAVYAGSRVRVWVAFDREPTDPEWRSAAGGAPFGRDGRDELSWSARITVTNASPYSVVARPGAAGEPVEIARGAVTIVPDALPSVRFENDSRNIYAWPGETVELRVAASDDHGMRAVAIRSRPAAAASAAPAVLREWTYGAAPGRSGEIRERHSLVVDPAAFEPGSAYMVEAVALDWRPGENPATGRSDPIVLRVRSANSADPAASARVAALQRAIAAQRRALGLSRNLGLHLDEAVAGANLGSHRDAMAAAQTEARDLGRSAAGEVEASDGPGAARLRLLVEGEMALALSDIGKVGAEGVGTDALARLVERIAGRQQAILDGLLSLLGSGAARERARGDGAEGAKPSPSETSEDAARDLRDFLRDFASVQRRILERSRSLLERGPENLSEEEEEILGKLARDEAELAAAARDKVDDISRNPLQDFADSSLAEEFNEIYQEVAKAAAALYERKIEMAVPMEQGGLENAERLLHNLERWLTDKPDYIKWLMEDPPTTPDAPLAELPDELEDIVGELLDSEEEMGEDVEDATSAWIDSLDKGAGWDAMDGPISSMSAKGVTGNQLPNQMEIGGRSGEGRTGRSQGQMVEAAAEGKDGRQTPARLSATPFEAGSVEDSSTMSPGGATGGGKLAGFAGEGLRGPAPAPRLQGLQRLAGKQMEIRQAAERLSLHLRAYGLPTGDIENAARAMRDVEALARAGDGVALRRAYDATLDSLREARGSVASAASARRERGAMPRKEAAELWDGLRDGVPAGYEEILPAYFRRLSEEAD